MSPGASASDTMVALATQRDLPDWEVDDRPFHAALTARGIAYQTPAWDDPDIDWRAFDAVLLRTTWDYAGQRDRFVAWIDRVAATTRLLNPPEIVRWNTDKHYLRDLERAGVPIAPTTWLEAGSQADVSQIVAARGWKRAFIKPVWGQTARETLRFDANPEGLASAQAHIDRLLPHEGLMVQPYLEAVETLGEHSGIFFDGELAHSVQKIPVPGDFRVMDDYGATDRPAQLDAKGIVVCQKALAAIPAPEPLLYARVDLLADNQGQWVVTELELVEPSLFFRHAPASAERFADALIRRLNPTG